jgi:hypothetical protein
MRAACSVHKKLIFGCINVACDSNTAFDVVQSSIPSGASIARANVIARVDLGSRGRCCCLRVALSGNARHRREAHPTLVFVVSFDSIHFSRLPAPRVDCSSPADSRSSLAPHSLGEMRTTRAITRATRGGGAASGGPAAAVCLASSHHAFASLPHVASRSPVQLASPQAHQPRRAFSTQTQVGAPLRKKVTSVDLAQMKKRGQKISSQCAQNGARVGIQRFACPRT